MAEYTHNENIFEMQTSSLMERLQSYFDDMNMWAHREGNHVEYLFKFRSLVLLAEIYDYVRQFFVYREARLSEYLFQKSKNCREFVVSLHRQIQNNDDYGSNGIEKDK